MREEWGVVGEVTWSCNGNPKPNTPGFPTVVPSSGLSNPIPKGSCGLLQQSWSLVGLTERRWKDVKVGALRTGGKILLTLVLANQC